MYTTVRHVIAHKGSTVHSVSPDATLDAVVALMVEHSIAAVLVKEQERVLGIVTERDCIAQVLWKRRFHAASRVGDLVSSNIPTVSPAESIQQCMQIMLQDRVRHLPVLDNGKLVGLISMGDVVHAQLSDQENLILSLEQYIGGPSTKPPPPF